MDRAARQAVDSVADVAEERVDVVVIGTPSGAVGRRAVVAVCVFALRLSTTQLKMLLVNFFGYELKQVNRLLTTDFTTNFFSGLKF